MTRRLVRASSQVIKYTAGAPNFTGLAFGTMAALFNRTSTSAAFYCVLGTTVAALNDSSAALFFNASNQPDFYIGGNNNPDTAVTVGSSDGWCLFVGTKATGSVAPVIHIYRFNTGAWTHNNAAAARANNSSFGADLYVGCDLPGVFNSYFDGDIAACMILNNRALSNREVEQLPRGLWEQWASGPLDFLWESPTQDQTPVVNGYRRLDYSRSRVTTTTAPGRSPLAIPAGFRMSAINRRL